MNDMYLLYIYIYYYMSYLLYVYFEKIWSFCIKKLFFGHNCTPIGTGYRINKYKNNILIIGWN